MASARPRLRAPLPTRASIDRCAPRHGPSDCVLIHSDGNDEARLLDAGALECLHARKQAGDLRAIGASTKTLTARPHSRARRRADGHAAERGRDRSSRGRGDRARVRHPGEESARQRPRRGSDGGTRRSARTPSCRASSSARRVRHISRGTSARSRRPGVLVAYARRQRRCAPSGLEAEYADLAALLAHQFVPTTSSRR